ncbi:hypothetical protein A2943_02420 [Candidatus Adlerbacteria bacterium RIFCSPLOWO2_01_FULL_51_16]|uniref:NERD domain-containing protein n=1 Tax=Candidatus Adlerbacteria bacterium RIFCSPLOWO2_01_FULL_51_16 TaxID=1797243 RepID=A0A1F4XGK3_9BACT|nr:MAG: hypothetical protein A2943_02420 [Candidatus Adlerbacteria bacterium RIFCSPLOWO2_01_FULL_51_16]
MVSVSFAAIVWIGVFILKWKLPFLIGRSGEKFVSKKLSDLDPIKYTILDNLMLPSDGNISTTQVDHVVVSNFGIFVIETKSYSGWIFGNAYQRNWTQVIYRYKKKFYNPLYQNYAHTKALETLIRPFYPKLPIIGFVAFPSAEKLQVSGTNAVGQARDIVRKIQSYTTEIISDADKTNVVEILTAYNLKDKQTRTSHLKSARNLKRARGF